MNAIIIGAGIAGPAMAIALKRLGMGVTLYEAREENEMGGGVFLGLTPNGLNVLKEFIDIDQLKGDYTAGTMEFYNARNKCIGRFDTRDQARKYGAETIQVKRARVSELLRQAAARQGIGIRYGHRLNCLTERAGGVEASFDNGHSHAAAFLIACDGIHSACRAALFPDAPGPVYTQQLSTGAMMRMSGSPPGFGAIKMVFGEQAFFAYAASNHNPLATFFRDLMLRHFIRFEKRKMDWVYRYRPGSIAL